MVNGKIGHFKFIMVDEIKNIGKFYNLRTNPSMISSMQETKLDQHDEIQDANDNVNDNDNNDNDNDDDDDIDGHQDNEKYSIYDKLESRLNESEGTMNLEDVLNIIGLSDCGYFNLFALNGFQDLDSFKKIGQIDTLDSLGITKVTDQRVLLNAAQIIREKFDNKSNCSNQKHQSHLASASRSSNELFSYFERDEQDDEQQDDEQHDDDDDETNLPIDSFNWNFMTQSAPVTPAVDLEPNLTDIIAKFSIHIEDNSHSAAHCSSSASHNSHFAITNSDNTYKNIIRINSYTDSQFAEV